jgi:hypothetical protein
MKNMTVPNSPYPLGKQGTGYQKEQAYFIKKA